MRGEVPIPNEMITRVKVKSGILNRIKKKYRMKKLDDFTPLKETLKQKIQLKAQSMRHMKKERNFTDTTIFLTQAKRNFPGNWESHK